MKNLKAGPSFTAFTSPEQMLLNNLRSVKGRHVAIATENALITSVEVGEDRSKHNLMLDLGGATVLPGLINSHDHLDFNLFPNFGNRRYTNYRQWGPYIQDRYKAEIDKILAVPQPLRTAWGIYKNLLAGVTTVAEHGDTKLLDSELINFIHPQHCIHSVGFEKHWRLKLNNPRKRKLPAVLHVGEGVDAIAEREVKDLLKWNLLRRKLIGIHGVAMTAAQATAFDGVVWCPRSNDFLFGETADIRSLKRTAPILFGTDSTLTGHWNMWQHLRDAQVQDQLNDGELLASVTTAPAMVWQLNSGEIADGKDADLVVVRPKQNIFATDPQDILLVMRRGEIVLFDESLHHQLVAQGYEASVFDRVNVAGTIKHVRGNITGLMAEIKKHNPKIVFPVEPA